MKTKGVTANFALKCIFTLILSHLKVIISAAPQRAIIRTPDELLQNDVLGPPLDLTDFKRASRITLGDFGLQDGQIDPIELAGLFEGDIALTPEELFITKFGDIGMRNAIINSAKKWPNAEVPYLISSTYDNMQRAMIAVAIITLHNETCIKFVPRTTQEDYIHILKGNGCSSPVGRVGGAQTVSLGNGCFYTGIIMHEFMHTTGFWHEHSRSDRDAHITIIWSNIQSGMSSNFEKYDWSRISSLGVPYDELSIMHYGPYAFAKDRTKPTIIPRRRVEIGQRRNFSEKDIQKINMLYQCPGFMGHVGVFEAQCLDNSPHCNTWAALGECENNPRWMLVNCKSSCKVCGAIEDTCENGNIHCSHWAENGECQLNPNYMLINCQKSCQSCV